MAKRIRRTRRTRPACKSRVARKCKKPRFTANCRAKFASCMRKTVQEPTSGSPFRHAGKKCMPVLHSCMRHGGTAAVRRYKRAKAR